MKNNFDLCNSIILSISTLLLLLQHPTPVVVVLGDVLSEPLIHRSHDSVRPYDTVR